MSPAPGWVVATPPASTSATTRSSRWFPLAWRVRPGVPSGRLSLCCRRRPCARACGSLRRHGLAGARARRAGACRAGLSLRARRVSRGPCPGNSRFLLVDSPSAVGQEQPPQHQPESAEKWSLLPESGSFDHAGLLSLPNPPRPTGLFDPHDRRSSGSGRVSPLLLIASSRPGKKGSRLLF
jgi:hypothetical protein